MIFKANKTKYRGFRKELYNILWVLESKRNTSKKVKKTLKNFEKMLDLENCL